jgi:hypothetical protein
MHVYKIIVFDTKKVLTGFPDCSILVSTHGGKAMEQNFSSGLRAFADAVDAHPEIFTINMGCVDYYATSLDRAQKIISAFPASEVRVHQANDLVTITVGFDGLVVHFNGGRDKLAVPTITDDKVIWIAKPELLKPPVPAI